MSISESSKELFFSHCVKSSDCLVWTIATDKDGYGKVQYKGKTIRASHLAFYIEYGRWPKSMLLHSCRNRACVEIKHLREGTAKENYEDRIKDGTEMNRERCPWTKLTLQETLEIEALGLTRRHTDQSIADLYGVSVARVRHIRIGKFRRYA